MRLLVLLFLVTPSWLYGQDRMPNLLIIQTDEHHFGTLGCYGGRIVGTPHIDRIAQEGALCTSFYATTPVCSPSRGSLVSGLYPQKTPVVNNNIPLGDSVVTFAQLLADQGYATGFAGKWHLDGAGKPQWAPSRKFGFQDNRFMYNRGHWKKFELTADGPAVAAFDKKGKPSYGLADADEKTFSTDWLCDRAEDFIRKNSARPFCYFVSLPDPHGPNTVRAPYDTMYDDVEIPIPLSLKRKRNQIPKWGAAQGVTEAQLRRIMADYYGMVKCIDDNIGGLIQTLESLGILDNTIIVMTSDHGDLCGEHGRLNKGVPYEGSARIPFVIRYPKVIPAGTVVNEALSCVDFLPTVMALMDHPVPHAVDGRDASALFQSSATEWDDVAFLRSTPGKPWLAAVTQQYKLVFCADDVPWLIDLKQDPDELTNLITQERHKPLIRKLSQAVRTYGTTHSDEYTQIPSIKAWINEMAADE